MISPRREASVSNAVGQSSSVPSSIPIRCVGVGHQQKRGKVVRNACATKASRGRCHTPTGPARPGAPWIPAAPRHAAGRRRARRSWPPLALAAHQQQAQLLVQPLEVAAAEVDVVHRVVEVRGVAALAPAVPGRRVIMPMQIASGRDAAALEREVGSVKRAKADAAGDQLARPTAVVAYARTPSTWSRIHDSYSRWRRARSSGIHRSDRRLAVERVHAVELRATGREQLAALSASTIPCCWRNRAGVAALGREREHRAAPVAIGRDAVHRTTHSRSSRPVRWGCRASRQPV